MSDVKLTVHPEIGLFDDVVDIQIRNLSPKQSVTLQSVLLTEGNDVFQCFVHYDADERGVVNVKSQPVIGGMYTGVERMGLYWGMEESKFRNRRRHIGIFKKDVCKPFIVAIAVYDGHYPDESALFEATPLAKVTTERWFKSAKVQRVKVHHGRLRGTMFIPESPGLFPGILDLRGNGGGIQEHRAAILASKGFVTFTLAYLGYEDLHPVLDVCDIEYFEEVVEFLLSHPRVAKHGVGGSRGFLRGYNNTCGVSINGPHFGQIVPMKYKERTWDALQMDVLRWRVEDGAIVVKDAFDIPENINHERLTIPIHKAKGHMMLISGEDDKTFPSSFVAEKARKLMDSGGKTNYVIIRYPKGGHMIEPPYNPYFSRFIHKVERKPFLFAGSKVGSARANEDSWKQYIAFFRKHLCSPGSQL